MFGPVRGRWPDENWKGWWGDTPVYQAPVFVLTHHARKPLEMKGGTTFYFVTDGIHVALERAMEAAGGKDVRVGGGASTIRQYLQAGLVDKMHTVVSPAFLGSGERLWDGLDLVGAGYECTGKVAGDECYALLHSEDPTHAMKPRERGTRHGETVGVFYLLVRWR